MYDQPNPSPAADDETIDSGILDLLLRADESRPFSVDEVVREIGHKSATDGLARLYGAGLVHRLDGFVWATRAAIKSDQLAL